jgi:hypothetical protein
MQVRLVLNKNIKLQPNEAINFELGKKKALYFSIYQFFIVNCREDVEIGFGTWYHLSCIHTQVPD